MSVRPAASSDLPAIDTIFRTSFCDTFAHLYAPEDLAAFLGQLTPERWQAELADPAFGFAVAEREGAPVGFAKLGPCKLPHVPAEGTIELRQFYFLKAGHGTGLAQSLMAWVLEEAGARGAERLALSVFSENWRAQAFYRRFGFVDRGPVIFMVGNHPDEDRVWVKEL